MYDPPIEIPGSSEWAEFEERASKNEVRLVVLETELRLAIKMAELNRIPPQSLINEWRRHCGMGIIQPEGSDDCLKVAPVQGYEPGIPWTIHLEAYEAYCKKYGPQTALLDLEKRNCRGGFHVEELDEFVPGWRERL